VNIRIPDDVVFRVLGDEAVILNLASGVYFGLDTVGTRMWQLMSEHGSTDKVIAAMLDEYAVEEGQLRSDLDKLIEQLSEKGLVKANAEETAPAE
jgi:coenzyme PQQ synthesis protein D (PqqD)